MSEICFANKYVSIYQNSNIPWYEHDGLLTYIDELKCKELFNNCDKHFFNMEAISFDIVHHKCRGDSLLNSVESYKTISKNDFKSYPEIDKKELLWVPQCDLEEKISE